MVVVSILPHAEIGPNDHREDAPHFRTLFLSQIKISGDTDQEPVVKSNEIPNIPVSEAIQSSIESSSTTELSATKPASTTPVTPVPPERSSTGAIKVNRFTINVAETITESK